MRYKKVLFIVTENHMFINYSLLDKLIKSRIYDYKVISLPQSDYNSFFTRILLGRNKFSKVKKYLLDNVPSTYFNDSLIIYSNAEGFLLSNRGKWMPKLNKCKEVLLQHGLMPMSNKLKCVRYILNVFSYFWGYNIIGKGFGGVKADYIIVFGEKYANYLVKEKKWDIERIISSTKILKPDIGKIEKVKSSSTCLFLLQDLSKCYMSKLQMLAYLKKIVIVLSKYYECVILRKHPKMTIDLSGLEKIDNVYISKDDLSLDILSASRVYSFFSSALIDASLYGKEIVAIKLPELSKSLYDSFNRVINVDELESYLSSYALFDKTATVNNEYYDMINDPEHIVDYILNN